MRKVDLTVRAITLAILSALVALCVLLTGLSAGFAVFGSAEDGGESEKKSAVVPTPAAVYALGDASLEADEVYKLSTEEINGETVTVYSYRDLAAGYNAAIEKATDIMYQDNPAVMVRLLTDWTAVQSTAYATSTRFGTGDGFNSGMLTVPFGATLIFDLNGKTVDRGMTVKNALGNDYPVTSIGSVFDVQGALLLCDSAGDGVVTGGKSANGGGINVSNYGKLYMYGGSVTGNVAGISGGGVALSQYAVFIMWDGKITNNTAEISGAGVSADSARFDMRGGEISSNTFGENRSGNSVELDGGGVYATARQSYMSVYADLYDENGVLNRVEYDESGDYTSYPVVMEIELSGGKIVNNGAYNGGGVYYTANMSCTLTDSIITENAVYGGSGGGVLGESNLNVSGSVRIFGNKHYEYINADKYSDCNINFAHGQSGSGSDIGIYVTGDFHNAKLAISDLNTVVYDYDSYNTWSTSKNIDSETGLPVDPATYITYDGAAYEGQYHTVRGTNANDMNGNVYASQYYAKWDLYFINENGTFGDKITEYVNDDRAELDGGFAVAWSFNDYVNPRTTGNYVYAFGLKASLYTKYPDGSLVAVHGASDLSSRYYRIGYGGTSAYISGPEDLKFGSVMATETEYNGEYFGILPVYKPKNIEDPDVDIKVVFDTSKLVFSYIANTRYYNLDHISASNLFVDFAEVTVTVNGITLNQGYNNDYTVYPSTSTNSTLDLHANKQGTLMILARGNYTGTVYRNFDDNGVEYKLSQASSDYYFTNWKKGYGNNNVFTTLDQIPAYVYTGADIADDFRLTLTVGNLPNYQELVNSRVTDFTQTVNRSQDYSSDDENLTFKIFKLTDGDWIEQTEARSVGRYKLVIDQSCFDKANSKCTHILDSKVANDAPDGTNAYFDMMFDITPLPIDFDTVFSESNSLPIKSLPDSYDGTVSDLPISVYLKDEHNVRDRMGDYLAFDYFDATLNQNRELNFAAPNSAYMANGQIKYVGEGEKTGYIYYTGQPFNIALKRDLVIGAQGDDPFLGGSDWYDATYWQTEEGTDDSYTGILTYNGHYEYDFTAYKDYIGSFYAYGMYIRDIAEITYSHEVTYADGTVDTIVNAPVLGRGNGEATYITTTVTVAFFGYSDADGNTEITFTKDWAIVSACNAVLDLNGDPYKFTESENGQIEYGGGNRTAPIPEYGKTLVIELNDPKNSSTMFVVDYDENNNATLYDYDENAAGHKGNRLYDRFSDYINTLCAIGGVGDYVLTVRPEEYTDKLTGLVYFGAEEIYVFTVLPFAIDSDNRILEVRIPDQTYTGNEIRPNVQILFDGKPVSAGNYTLAFSDNVNAGDATVVIEGMGVFDGSRTEKFKIVKATDNEWNNIYIADWWYTKFDVQANRIFANAKYGYDDAEYTVLRVIEGTDGSEVYERADERLEGFKLDADGIAGQVPGNVTEEGTVAYILNSLTMGKYLLRAEVIDTDNYSGAETECYFAVYATDYITPSLNIQTSGIGKNDVYTGNVLSVNLENYNSAAMTVEVDERLEQSGLTLYATKAGSYTIKFTLKDAENSAWSDGFEGAERVIVWVIEKQAVAIPESGDSVFYITGNEIVYVPKGFDPEIMEITGNVQIGAGKYDAFITLKDTDNYKWADPDYGDVITRQFEILGAMRIFVIVISVLGGVLLLFALAALVQFIMHRQRMKVFAIANDDNGKNNDAAYVCESDGASNNVDSSGNTEKGGDE